MYGVERFMNITGNHDIGYAGELNMERLSRWENAFGNASHLHTLQIPGLPPLRIILYNTLNLDSPATDRDLQQSTYTFLQSLLPESDDVPIPQTILLTHLPLYRTVCNDLPRFEYWSLNITNDKGNVTGYFRPIKHQNHLSRWASDWILDTIFGDEYGGVILGGHDHTGCDVLHRKVALHPEAEDTEVVHDELRLRDELEQEEWDEEGSGNEVEALDDEFSDQEEGTRGNIIEPALKENFDQSDKQEENITRSEPEEWEIAQNESHIRNNRTHGVWRAEKFRPGMSGIREITVRSMMGDFQGNVGLLTASYNNDTRRTTLPFPFPHLFCRESNFWSMGIRLLLLSIPRPTLVVGSPYLGWNLRCMGGRISHPSALVATLAAAWAAGSGAGLEMEYGEFGSIKSFGICYHGTATAGYGTGWTEKNVASR